MKVFRTTRLRPAAGDDESTRGEDQRPAAGRCQIPVFYSCSPLHHHRCGAVLGASGTLDNVFTLLASNIGVKPVMGFAPCGCRLAQSHTGNLSDRRRSSSPSHRHSVVVERLHIVAMQQYIIMERHSRQWTCWQHIASSADAEQQAWPKWGLCRSIQTQAKLFAHSLFSSRAIWLPYLASRSPSPVSSLIN